MHASRSIEYTSERMHRRTVNNCLVSALELRDADTNVFHRIPETWNTKRVRKSVLVLQDQKKSGFTMEDLGRFSKGFGKEMEKR